MMFDDYGYGETRRAIAKQFGVATSFIERSYPDAYIRAARAEAEAAGSDITASNYPATVCARCEGPHHHTAGELATAIGLLNAVYFLPADMALLGSYGRRAAATDSQIREVHDALSQLGTVGLERCVAQSLALA